MKLRINGSSREVDFGEVATVEALVRIVAPRGVPCAVEVNRQVVPFARRGETELRDGDSVEIVTLVGGG
ncbi:MAG: sulfur carrier protein ThiS [Phycisphaerae bacterium]|nr:sulfur carrier protein ThiS [Phycisphaerae bacterium]